MIQDNLTAIKNRITAAALRVNRSPADIKLVAVSKRIPDEKILQAIEFGHYTFGENYVQEAQDKIPLIRNKQARNNISFHFIGKLQSNKAGKAAELFDVIQTIDSAKLAGALEKHLASLNKTLSAYLQVNIGKEKQKSGIMPEDCGETKIRCNARRLRTTFTGTITLSTPADNWSYDHAPLF
jgi:pyridoxal phosphate enzyme (YggS family)